MIHSFAAPRARQLEKTSAAGATLMITVRESQAEMLPVLLPALAAGLAPTGKAAFAGGRRLNGNRRTLPSCTLLAENRGERRTRSCRFQFGTKRRP